jgi:hypothetical protein
MNKGVLSSVATLAALALFVSVPVVAEEDSISDETRSRRRDLQEKGSGRAD